MKPLPFLCAIIGLNILWLPGLCELSSERGNLGVCPQLRSNPLAPAWLHLPGYLSEGSQRCHRTAFAGLRPSPSPSGTGEAGRLCTPTSTPARGCGGTGWPMPGGAGGLGERHPQGPKPGALRQMKSVPQMGRSKSRHGQMGTAGVRCVRVN